MSKSKVNVVLTDQSSTGPVRTQLTLSLHSVRACQAKTLPRLMKEKTAMKIAVNPMDRIPRRLFKAYLLRFAGVNTGYYQCRQLRLH